jgi:hypothetical protein
MRAGFRIGLVGLALTTMIGGATVAHAGFTVAIPVTISNSGASGRASGSMRDTRNTPDSYAYIYCGSRISSTGQTVSCAATSTTGEFKTCTVSDASALTYSLVVASLSDSSYIDFAWDASGKCTDIHVMNGSWLLR